MEKTFKKTASESLKETLERSNSSFCYRTTFPASLFRSKTSGQVLYLEADKDFVDTLLSFLLLSLGTVIRVLSAGIQVKPALCGISSIFESVQNFSASDLEMAKELLVQSRPAVIGCSCRSSGLAMQRALEDASILPRPPHKRGLGGDFYVCRLCDNLAQSLNLSGGYCGVCSKKGSTFSSFPMPTAYSVLEKEVDLSSVGFVKANTTFIVTDNLEIMPLTTNKSVNVLSKLNVDSLADLEGNDITVTLTQILQLLNSALTSNNCLTEVSGKSKRSSLRWCEYSEPSVAVCRQFEIDEF